MSLDTPGKPATPDVCIAEKKPIDRFDDTPRETTPPLVAIEFASPSQGFGAFIKDVERYFDFG